MAMARRSWRTQLPSLTSGDNDTRKYFTRVALHGRTVLSCRRKLIEVIQTATISADFFVLAVASTDRREDLSFAAAVKSTDRSFAR